MTTNKKTTSKTWAQLSKELADEFRKWGREYVLASQLAGRSAGKRYQTREEREVTLMFTYQGNPVKLSMVRYDRAIDNLAAIVRVITTMRLAESRGEAKALAILCRQMYAQQTPIPQPPKPAPAKQIPSHFKLLHLTPDAPLSVAEAVYRALAKQYHRDQGGSDEMMKRLNEAIEIIRREKKQ